MMIETVNKMRTRHEIVNRNQRSSTPVAFPATRSLINVQTSAPCHLITHQMTIHHPLNPNVPITKIGRPSYIQTAESQHSRYRTVPRIGTNLRYQTVPQMPSIPFVVTNQSPKDSTREIITLPLLLLWKELTKMEHPKIPIHRNLNLSKTKLTIIKMVKIHKIVTKVINYFLALELLVTDVPIPQFPLFPIFVQLSYLTRCRLHQNHRRHHHHHRHCHQRRRLCHRLGRHNLQHGCEHGICFFFLSFFHLYLTRLD